MLTGRCPMQDGGGQLRQARTAGRVGRARTHWPLGGIPVTSVSRRGERREEDKPNACVATLAQTHGRFGSPAGHNLTDAGPSNGPGTVDSRVSRQTNALSRKPSPCGSFAESKQAAWLHGPDTEAGSPWGMAACQMASLLLALVRVVRRGAARELWRRLSDRVELRRRAQHESNSTSWRSSVLSHEKHSETYTDEAHILRPPAALSGKEEVCNVPLGLGSKMLE
ncbi:hypothetical protein BCV70DRAFT_204382 [Testicularia cyperi]|uniref:Uncharacterized protein n=1 Tax=Testicularia cyperi TaxID=1882483 RepID=A0A317Y0E2_9BASI|nr:hypothetical protein BCV70DRAFT_204382 [Testicularia cyperi]